MSNQPHPQNPSHHPAPTVRLALIQHRCGPDPSANLDKAIELIRHAADRGAQIIATQELFTSVYFPQAEDAARFSLAETIPGPTTRRLCDLAAELDVEITASLFEKRTQGIYHNTSVMIGPAQGGRITGMYRKMHIPDDPRFYEKFYFTPGDAPPDAAPAPGSDLTAASRVGSADTPPRHTGWQAHDTRHAKVGMLVCWDQWFPEAARLTALRGAQVLFYPTAIGWGPDETPTERDRQKDAWQTVQRSHAIANGVFVAAINRVGVEGDLKFWGSSFVVDPGGTVIAQADGEGEQVVIADCDLSLIDEHRQAWPFLRDRRVDAYAGLTQRYLGD